jgi:hypothetical protein
VYRKRFGKFFRANRTKSAWLGTYLVEEAEPAQERQDYCVAHQCFQANRVLHLDASTQVPDSK